MKSLAACCCLIAVLVFAGHAVGQGDKPNKAPNLPENGVRLGKPVTHRWQMGISATGTSASSGLYATLAVPIEWPEQSVKVVSEECWPKSGKIKYRTLDNCVKQLLFRVPRLAADEEAKVLVTYEITRYELEPPADTERFVIPIKAPKEVLKYLGPSPSIEVQDPAIKALAKELLAEKKDAPAWAQVEALYDGVRAKVAYKHDDVLRGALAALQTGVGDCEELSSLFVAVCRINKIPARCVWVNSHTYPEFYLQDENGVGHWFPCQAAGGKEFGGIRDLQPILQKGDSFKVPEYPKPQRYVHVFFKVDDHKGGPPMPTEIRKLLPVE